jgi:hypothetical protein
MFQLTLLFLFSAVINLSSFRVYPLFRSTLKILRKRRSRVYFENAFLEEDSVYCPLLVDFHAQW